MATTISSTSSGGDWSASTTWVGGVVPTITDDVIISAGAIVVIKTPYAIGSGATCNSLTIDGTLTLGSGSTVNRELDITTFLVVDVGGTLNQGGNAYHEIHIAGDFTNNGTFTPSGSSGSLNFIFNGTGSHQINCSVNTMTFADFKVNGSAISFGGNITSVSVSVFRLSSGSIAPPATLTASSDFISTSGTFTAGNSLAIGGNFTCDGGTFTAGSGTVTFAGTTQLVGGSQSTTFNNVTILGTSSTTISTAPTINGNVLVNDGATLTITPNITVNGSTTIGSGTSGSLIILSGSPKIFNGLVTINAGATWNNAVNQNIHLGGGLTNLGTFTSGTGTYFFETNAQQVSGNVTVGTADVTIALTNNGTFSVTSSLQNLGSLTQGVGSMLNIGGSSGISTMVAAAAGNTVNYSGTAQSVNGINYVNLGLSGTGAKTLSTSTTSISGNLSLSGSATSTTVIPLTIGGQLLIGDGTTLSLAAGDLTVTGTTVVGNGTSGNLVFTSTGGTKTFVGNVTVSTGATWNNSIGKNVHFQNGIQNNGTFTAGSEIYFFEVNNQSVGGTLSVSNVNVAAGITLTNSGTLSTSNDLSVDGALTQGLNSVLNIGGTSPINSLDATSSANTVNYTGVAQFIKGFNYYNLILSGSGSATLLSGISTVAQNFTISGSITTGTSGAMTIGGNFSLSDGSTFNINSFDFNVGGNTTIGSGASGDLIFTSPTGVKTFTGMVTVSAGATWDNSSSNSTGIFQGGITNSGTFLAGTGIQTFNTNSQTLAGIFSIPSITVTGVTLTNNNTLTVSTSLSGTGTLLQASNSTLSLGGTSSITTLSANNTGNTVNFSGAVQSINSNNYYNLNLSGSGSKTFNVSTSIAGSLAISGTAVANLGTFTTHTANTLSLGGTAESAGTWGGQTGPPPTFVNSTYFAATSGYITISTVVPIILLSFNGEVEKSGVLLKWTTASEINNNYFTVLHSTSGANFKSIGEVKGNGTTSELHSYSLFNHNPVVGNNFYQLRQTDFDGGSSSSEIISVSVLSIAPLVSIYPNPISQNQLLHVLINGLSPNITTALHIFNMQGTSVLDATLNTYSDGTLSTEVVLTNLVSGLYILTVQNVHIKFVVE